MNTVTVEISTKDRYNTTLPMAIASVASQAYPIEKLVIYDDGEQKDLRNVEPYPSLFYLLEQKKIAWYILFGARKGQVWNHIHALENCTTDLILRLDDDNYIESNVLEKLIRHMKPDVGAVSGKVWSPGMPLSEPNCSPNKIEDLRISPNLQWTNFSTLTEVDHIYNAFLYRREAGLKYGFPKNLSPVGNGEETCFTYGIRKAGYKLLLDPEVIIWHLRAATGGIRTGKEQWFIDDEIKTNEQLKFWGVKLKGVPQSTPVKREDSIDKNQTPTDKIIVLDNGLGDHLMFKMILPEIKAKYGDSLVLAVCYPEVFEDDNVKLISIADAKSKIDIEPQNIYAFCDRIGWKSSLVDAFRKMYL